MSRVLLVDDDPKLLRAMEIALGVAGYEIRTAGGAEQALEVAAEFLPDLMVVDVMMPTGTEGFHLVWAVRQLADPQLRNVPIIIASGVHGETELRFYPEKTDGTYKPGEFLPVQGWLDKPVQMADLKAKIEAILD
jgi:CheY-like chemotaxis protein